MFLRKSHEYNVFEYKNGVWDSNNLYNDYCPYDTWFQPFRCINKNNEGLIFNDSHEKVWTIKAETDYLNVWTNNNKREEASAINFPGVFLEEDSLGKGVGQEITSICEYGDYIVAASYIGIMSYHKINKTFHTAKTNNGGIVVSKM
jgi:hypothetical protein